MFFNFSRGVYPAERRGERWDALTRGAVRPGRTGPRGRGSDAPCRGRSPGRGWPGAQGERSRSFANRKAAKHRNMWVEGDSELIDEIDDG